MEELADEQIVMSPKRRELVSKKVREEDEEESKAEHDSPAAMFISMSGSKRTRIEDFIDKLDRPHK